MPEKRITVWVQRYANIKTTMDYYANVDAAAMEAVLGDRRNSSRNSEPPAAGEGRPALDATPSPGSPNSPSAG